MKTEKLSKHLKKLAREYAEKTNALDYYSYEDKAFRYCQIKYEKIKLEFVYALKGSESYPISTLSCRVYLSPERPYFYEIQELIDYLDIYDYHCYSFPYIESIKRLEACFNYITDFIEYRSDDILSLCENAEIIKVQKLKEIKRVYGYDGKSAPRDYAGKESFYGGIYKHYSDYIICRYTSERAYVDFVSCNYQSSLSKYKSISNKTGYERKLIQFIKGQVAPYQAVTNDCASILDFEKYSKPDTKKLILTTVISVAAFYILFVLLQAIINLIYVKTTLFSFCANPFLNGLCGIIPGIAAAAVFRRRIEPILYPNKKQAYDFYDLLELSEDKKFGSGWAVAALILSFAVFIGICRPAITINSKYLKADTQASIFINYEKYETSELKKVMYIKGYYAKPNYRDYVEEPYFAIITNDNRVISTRGINLQMKDVKEIVRIIHNGAELEYIDGIPAIEYLY